MIISIISAMAENRTIGGDNRIPWHLPDDLQRFRNITMGNPVVMGRKTFESIGKPLEGRKNIVITRNRDYRAEGCTVVHGLREALAECAGAEEAFICGGGEIFAEALPLADRIYLTLVHKDSEGDTYFPEVPDGFTETEREEVGGELPHSFVTYERRR